MAAPHNCAVLINILKSRPMVAVPIYDLAPHGSRTHPQAVLAVQCAVDHHRLPGLRVEGGSNDFVEIALEMPVQAGLDVHRALLEKRAGEILRRAKSYFQFPYPALGTLPPLAVMSTTMLGSNRPLSVNRSLYQTMVSPVTIRRF